MNKIYYYNIIILTYIFLLTSCMTGNEKTNQIIEDLKNLSNKSNMPIEQSNERVIKHFGSIVWDKDFNIIYLCDNNILNNENLVFYENITNNLRNILQNRYIILYSTGKDNNYKKIQSIIDNVNPKSIVIKKVDRTKKILDLFYKKSLFLQTNNEAYIAYEKYTIDVLNNVDLDKIVIAVASTKKSNTDKSFMNHRKNNKVYINSNIEVTNKLEPHEIETKSIVQEIKSNDSLKPIFDPDAQLIKAASNGDLAEAKRMVLHGANINAITKSGATTALIESVRKGHYDIFLYLVKKGANVNQTDIYGETALDWAIELSNRKSGSDPDKAIFENIIDQLQPKRKIRQNSVLNLKKTQTFIKSSLFNSELNITKVPDNLRSDNQKREYDIFKKKNEQNNKDEDEHEDCNKKIAYSKNKFEEFVHDIDYELIKASSEGNITRVESLLSQGANINATPKSGKTTTPLIEAVRKANVEMVSFLVKKGADIDFVDFFNDTALKCALEHRNKVKDSALRNQYDIIINILLNQSTEH